MKTMNILRFKTFAHLATVFAVAALVASTPVVRAQDSYGAQPGHDSQQNSQSDPPSVVGRLSVLQGNVSLQPAGAQDFSAAEINYPLTDGDRLYTDNGARSEVQVGQLTVRLGQQTDLTVSALSDQVAQFGLAQGSVHLRAYALDPYTTTEVDTPNASVTLLQDGDTRIDVYPQDNVTVVTALSGEVQVNADGVQQVVQAGQSLEVSGSGPAQARFVGRARQDDLDRFSGQRDVFHQQAFASEGSYINADTVGAADLATYGDWDNSADYGAVWYPRGLAVDWSPYSVGHWALIQPWGWTWVGSEPWGFAPYHYGRWNRFGNRWGWVPGPRVVRPVYSPALVVFVGGGGGGGLSISIGGGSGRVAAWFPLGPREVYHPWYRSSPVYVNRVNVTNIYNRNTVEVTNIYNNRTTNVYVNNQPAAYVNRSVATVAIPERSFGTGRPVRESAVKVDARQLQSAPVATRPPVVPQQQVAAARPPAKALPAKVERPVLDTRGNGAPNLRGRRDGGNVNAAAPGTTSRGQTPPQGSAPAKPNRGNTSPPVGVARPADPQTLPPPRNANQGGVNGGRPDTGRAPVQPNPAAPNSTQPNPAQPARGAKPAPVQTPAQPGSAQAGPRRQAPDAPIRTEPQPPANPPSSQQRQQPTAARPITERPAATPAPQPQQPSLEQQRQAQQQLQQKQQQQVEQQRQAQQLQKQQQQELQLEQQRQAQQQLQQKQQQQVEQQRQAQQQQLQKEQQQQLEQQHQAQQQQQQKQQQQQLEQQHQAQQQQLQKEQQQQQEQQRQAQQQQKQQQLEQQRQAQQQQQQEQQRAIQQRQQQERQQAPPPPPPARTQPAPQAAPPEKPKPHPEPVVPPEDKKK